jgi:hypothetical protein
MGSLRAPTSSHFARRRCKSRSSAIIRRSAHSHVSVFGRHRAMHSKFRIPFLESSSSWSVSAEPLRRPFLRLVRSELRLFLLLIYRVFALFLFHNSESEVRPSSASRSSRNGLSRGGRARGGPCRHKPRLINPPTPVLYFSCVVAARALTAEASYFAPAQGVSKSSRYLFHDPYALSAFTLIFSVGRAVRTSMCSPGTGESEARLRLASRTVVRCHILWQIARESTTTDHISPLETRPVARQAVLVRQHRAVRRVPPSGVSSLIPL